MHGTRLKWYSASVRCHRGRRWLIDAWRSRRVSRTCELDSFALHLCYTIIHIKMFAARSVSRALNGARAFSTSPAHSLARMQIIGRLADQPELTPTSTGREIVRYALGVKSGPKNENGERQTSWFRVASFAEGPGRDALLNLPKG